MTEIYINTETVQNGIIKFIICIVSDNYDNTKMQNFPSVYGTVSSKFMSSDRPVPTEFTTTIDLGVSY